MSGAAPLLEARHLRYSWPDGTPGLHGADMRLREGDRVALLGPNGAGKSTLLLLLAGLLPARGGILLEGREAVGRSGRRALRERVGLLFQNPDDMLFSTSVEEDVAFGPRQAGLEGDALQERVDSALAALGLTSLRHRPPLNLSLGQKKRAALAAVLALRPQVLALDEPMSGLDPRGRSELGRWLLASGRTLLFATHSLELARRLATRALVMDGGRVVADGAVEGLLQDRELLVRHGLLQRDPGDGG